MPRLLDTQKSLYYLPKHLFYHPPHLSPTHQCNLHTTASSLYVHLNIEHGYTSRELRSYRHALHIAFNDDAVIFSDKSELVYKTQGMAAFHVLEDAQQDNPMGEGN
ncbi:TPA: 5'-nucleotidase [Salmonella enterica]|uniref:Uncharacterized protein n=1 Tax=Salmonella rubislaw TaxID=598 RepID=A0A5W9CH44_SALRU|nr:hypothetical protein [Salmonella enterica]EBL1801881.1 5'-nucleotidase [Salmonella enterica subsp. enterica serovar Rubislaw]EAM9827129.1 hypothetical protein [Salmonella enterica]EAQ7294362.1 hypothetical protein [Salmonella enterica]EBV5651246.1 hypothetical protein [Salmonella enterica subsp. enterica serovar Rubislaw]